MATRNTISSGDQFGRLTAVRFIRRTPNRQDIWECRCQCGTIKNVGGGHLRALVTISCGCLAAELASLRRRHGLSNTKTHAAWKAMRQRCINPNHKDYPRYGGRGISICNRWESFELFLQDMGEAPAGMSLDRFPNNDGNYEPGNCRWATGAQQTRNRSCTKSMTIDGVTKPVAEWARVMGVPYYTMLRRASPTQ